MLMGPDTFVPLAWLGKKQGAVSHSTTEAETISLDAGLRLEALPLLSLWDIIVDVFTSGKDKDDLRVQNAGGTIVGNGKLAAAHRAHLTSSNGMVLYKCPNDVLIFRALHFRKHTGATSESHS